VSFCACDAERAETGHAIVASEAARPSGGQRQGTGTDSCDAERADRTVLPYLRRGFSRFSFPLYEGRRRRSAQGLGGSSMIFGGMGND